MVQARTVHICMAPSVELLNPDAQTMGYIAEKNILRDYLDYTTEHPAKPPKRPKSNLNDWWDAIGEPKYSEILLKRHGDVIDRDALKRLGEFKRPDISTWEGHFRVRLENGVSFDEKPGLKRSEHYEIKPDNPPHIKRGQEKLASITGTHRTLKLSGYKRGKWYPPKPHPQWKYHRVHFWHSRVVLDNLKYQWRRIEAALRSVGLYLFIHSPYLEVELKQPGLLLYRICIELDVNIDATDAFAGELACIVVRETYDHLLAGLDETQKGAETRFAASLRPVSEPPQFNWPPARQDSKVDIAKRAIARANRFEIIARVIGEIEALVPSFRNVLFTRRRGVTGDQFLVCCDKAYFQSQVLTPRSVEFARKLHFPCDDCRAHRAFIASIFLGGASSPDWPDGLARRLALQYRAPAFPCMGSPSTSPRPW